jgi:hypothetical protein
MKSINIEKIAECVLKYCKEEKVIPYIISLTIVYGMRKGNSYETPDLIISLETKEEILKSKMSESYQALIWNQAEYEHQEIAYACISNYFGDNCKDSKEYYSIERSYEYYTKLFIGLKDDFLNYIHKNSSFKPIVYVQDVHDDYKTVVKMNFTQNEIVALEKKGLY